jgi:hypothetical protein
MKYRKLRIAWSVGWGVLCLLLIALWVRSYRRCDIAIASLTATWVGVVSTSPGQVIVQRYTPNNVRGWGGISAHDVERVYHAPPYVSALGFGLLSSGGRQGVHVPFWCLVMCAAFFAVVDFSRWKWRFSLRTLLIGMTAVAVVLGLILALSR